MPDATPLPLFLAALLSASCVSPRLDGSSAPSHAFDQPELTQAGAKFNELASEHEGESALHLLGTGPDAFAARVSVITRAERTVDAQYYMFHPDVTGKYLLHSMLAAADRGVRVRLLLDDLGTSGMDELLAAANIHPNLEVRLFNPRARGPWTWLAKTLDTMWRPMRINRRMHNKMLCRDGLVLVVGGRNIGDEYFGAAQDTNFADLDMLAIGPVATQAGESFDLYWNSSLVERLDGWSSFRRDTSDLEQLQAALEQDALAAKDSEYAERLGQAGSVSRALAGSVPLIWAPTRAMSDLPWKIIARGDEVPETLLIKRLGDALPPAQEELLIVSPYFVPQDAGVEYLCGKVAEGVRVRVLTNALAATDVPPVHAAYKHFRRDLLAGGVELYELMPSGEAALARYNKGAFGSKGASLHAKTFIVDRRHVFVGSLNLDPRSIQLNTELGLVIESEELAAQLQAVIERIIQPTSAWRVSLEDKKLVWNGMRDGTQQRFTKDPGTSWWLRCRVWFTGLLPIGGQL